MIRYSKVNFVMFSNLNVGWVCKTWFQDKILVLNMGARKCPCKVIANSWGGGWSLKESLMYELEFLVGFGDSNLKPSLREVWISPRAPR